jgi:hypothetical protein
MDERSACSESCGFIENEVSGTWGWFTLSYSTFTLKDSYFSRNSGILFSNLASSQMLLVSCQFDVWKNEEGDFTFDCVDIAEGQVDTYRVTKRASGSCYEIFVGDFSPDSTLPSTPTQSDTLAEFPSASATKLQDTDDRGSASKDWKTITIIVCSVVGLIIIVIIIILAAIFCRRKKNNETSSEDGAVETAGEVGSPRKAPEEGLLPIERRPVPGQPRPIPPAERKIMVDQGSPIERRPEPEVRYHHHRPSGRPASPHQMRVAPKSAFERDERFLSAFGIEARNRR